MGAIESLQAKLKRLNDDLLIAFLQSALNKHQADITELNKKQLEKGEKADGSMFEEYSHRTVKIRQLEGNPVKGRLIALYDTGDFWKGFWSIAKDGKLSMLSRDQKTNMLISKYGESIFGLTDSNFKKLGDIIMPTLQKTITKYLQV